MQETDTSRKAIAPRIWAWALGLGLPLLLVAGVALWHLRSETIDSQTRELNTLSLALSDEMHRTLQGIQSGMHAMQDELRYNRIPLTGADAEEALRTRTELMTMVRSLWLVSHDGRVLAASTDMPLPEQPDFSPPLNKLDTETTAIGRSHPEQNRTTTAVTLAAQFITPQHHGWIYAALPSNALLGAFTVASQAPDAHMSVFRQDGVLLAASYVRQSSLSEQEIAQRLANHQRTAVHEFPDGRKYLVALRRLPNYGLDVVITRDLDVILAPWRDTVKITLASIVLLLAIMGIAVFLVERADQRRIAAQQALQAQVSRASKLESLGVMAGSVAHDFNNALAAIVGFGEMAQDAAAPGSAQARHIDKVLQAALRGKSLVERILSFGRGGGCTSTVFELEPIIEEVLTLLAATLRPGVVLQRGLEAHGALLRGDPTQAFEAVMNLCTNAIQAMPHGGMVSVQLVRKTVTLPQVLSHTQLPAGNYLALTVSDQGKGISPEVMERLFEPFFTTRSADSGTGLGLAVVHGVVAEFNGAIDVKSKPLQGARFTLYFPECTDVLASATPLLPSAPCGAGQTLLVVDDEPGLVAMAEEILGNLGYRTVGFIDPMAALQALRDEPERFSAVMTDEVMPALTGIQLTHAVRQFAPQLPILMVSGYGGALLAQRATEAGISRLLTKPLQRADLARALSELVR